MSKKVLGFTHTDLDGVGCRVLIENYAKGNRVECDVHMCNYDDIDKTITQVINTYKIDAIAEVIIADISVSENTANFLDYLYRLGTKIRLRDHHKTAEFLNKYEWAVVQEKDENGIPTCGTVLLYNEEDIGVCNTKLRNFVYEVNQWDTWLWKKNNDQDAVKLNSLHSLYGSDKFVGYTQTYVDEYTLLTPTALNDYNIMSTIKENTAKRCYRDLMKTYVSVDGEIHEKYEIGIVFCNEYISDVADYILDREKDLDFVMLIGFPNSISLRTRREDIDLGPIANKLTGSGGGHPQSAGATIPDGKFAVDLSLLLDSLSEFKACFGLPSKENN